MSSSAPEKAPCAGCSHLLRECVPGCAFAPYFPPGDGAQFGAVDKVFGASNVAKLLAEIVPQERADAVESLVSQATNYDKFRFCNVISPVNTLRIILEAANGHGAAERVDFEQQVFAVADRKSSATCAMSSSAAAPEKVPCAGCSHLGQECVPGCTFAPYFLPGREAEFAAVDNIFGASNVAKLVAEFRSQDRAGVVEASSAPCAGCIHLRRACVPGCAFAPYFPPGDGARFAVMDKVFGASNVAKLLAEIVPEGSKDAVKWLVVLATNYEKDPANRFISPVNMLRIILEAANGHGAAERVEFEQQVTAAVVDQKSAATSAREQVLQEKREKQVTAAVEGARQKKQKVTAVVTGPGIPRQQVAHAAKGKEKRKYTRRQHQRQSQLATTAQHPAAMGSDASLGGLLPHPLAPAAAARLTTEEYMRLMTMPQPVAGGQQHDVQEEHHAGLGLTTDQNMTTMPPPPVARGQQHHIQAKDYTAMWLSRPRKLTLMPQEQDHVAGQQQHNYPDTQQIANAQPLSNAAEVAREQELMMQQQQQGYAHAMLGPGGSGATATPLLPAGPPDAPPFLVQQQPPPQPQPVNALGFPEVPPQQENDGGDEGMPPDELEAWFTGLFTEGDGPPDGT